MQLQNTYKKLAKILHKQVQPQPVKEPRLVVYNEALADSLGIDGLATQDHSELAQIFAGNQMLPGSEPIAQAYAGHQFGHFNILGDGRAILLGEWIDPLANRWDIQLKGSGRTPYSRRGDGLAALGPMLREYLISEAMAALGIPTTRSLAVVATGEPVFRRAALPGAILTRISASYIRVGTFEYAFAVGGSTLVKALADYAIDRHDPKMNNVDVTDSRTANRYLLFLDSVIDRQASLVAKWMCIGFIHGVMNTDNMTISGETIDYGPCAFMDTYDPATVFSSIDHQGRYALGNQPAIAQWNLTRFAETLLPLFDSNETNALSLARESLATFKIKFKEYYYRGMGAKLGLLQVKDTDESLVEDLLKIMHEAQADYTNTFYLRSEEHTSELQSQR